MSSVNITNVHVLDNPAKWPTPLQFEITFECLTPLQEGT
jgi:histone chaperone ASF1